MDKELISQVQTLARTLSKEEYVLFVSEIEKIQNDARALEMWLRTEQQILLKKKILAAHTTSPA